MNKKPNRGFTLVELLVVMSVIAILSSIAMVVFTNTQVKARDSKRMQDLGALKEALYLYKTSTGTFCFASCDPVDFGYYVGDAAFGADGTNASSMKNKLTPTYIQKIPRDPLSSNWDYYVYITDSEHFTIGATLERPPVTPCTAITNSNYCVTQ